MKLFKQYQGLRKELYFLFIGRIMTNLGSMIWPMLTLILSGKLGFTATQISIYTLIHSIVALPMSLLGGKLADKFNKRNIIVICDLISISGFITCFFMGINLLSIIIFSISSLFQSIEWPSYDALVADFTTSKDRERAYSLSYLGSNLGLVLAPTLGGLLFNNYLHIAFLINGLAIALSTILIFIFIKDVHRENDTSKESIYEKDLDHKSSAFKFIFKNRVILIYVLLSAIASVVYSMYNYLMPLDLTAAFPETGSTIYGTLSSVNCIVVVACTALITKLFLKVKDMNKMIIGESLIIGGLMIFAFLHKQVWICYIAIVIFTWGEIFNTISSSPFMTRRIPASHRGRIISINSVFINIFQAVVQIGVGAIYDDAGSTTAWLFIMGLGAIVIALLFVLRIFDKKDYKELYNLDNALNKEA